MQAEAVEADRQEESGYFFKRVGELCFNSDDDVRVRPSGTGLSRQLAVSNSHGVLAFADGLGRRCTSGG